MFILTFSGCAPDAPITKVHIPPAPEVQKNVKPLVVEIQTNNKALKETVTVQERTIQEQKTEIDQVIATAESLRASVGTDQVIVTDLVARLNSVKMRNLFLETTNSELMGRLNNQMVLTEEAVERASLKDAESMRWQEMNVTKDILIRDLEKERNTAMIQRDKSAIEAANAGVYKRWIIWGVVGFVLWTIIKNVLMIYFPLAKFRV